jgi:Zn-finger nucleic acid-binding protein
MKCPNCGDRLEVKQYNGIEVNQCSKCEGMWFDFKELDDLEDKIFSDDDMKGTLVWDKRTSERICPKCNKKMAKFNYRLNDLELDYCEDMHGYWLDKGEEQRVISEMKEAVEKLDKKFKIEDEWANQLNHLKSPSFFSKLTNLFK